jgi:hypothetical protein
MMLYLVCPNPMEKGNKFRPLEESRGRIAPFSCTEAGIRVRRPTSFPGQIKGTKAWTYPSMVLNLIGATPNQQWTGLFSRNLLYPNPGTPDSATMKRRRSI